MSELENLSSSLFGGVLGGLGSFAAAAWTILATRRGDRARETQRLKERDAERREALVAKFVGTLRALETEVRWAPFMAGRTSARLIEATINFYASQRAEHPEVASWVMQQMEPIQSSLGRWHRWWWAPWLARRHLKGAANQIGELAGALTLWTTSEIPDPAFSNSRHSPRQIIDAARALEKART